MLAVKNGLLCLLLSTAIIACTGKYSSPVTNRGIEKRPVSHSSIHIVKPGETLYSIAWQYGLDYSEIARWNHIRVPYNIFPTQKLQVKPPSKTVSNRAEKNKPAGYNKKKKKAEKKKKAKKKKSSRVIGHAINNVKIVSWSWPVKGKILRGFSAASSGKKGIAIKGKRGQKIRAAASGKVVYSGGGLLRYGKLIIIKHNKSFLSAYAHNDKLLVKEGEWVKANQPIATMGSSGTNRTMLHFEIRKNGKPVNPVRYLPKLTLK